MNKVAKLLKEISEITKDDPHLIYRDYEEVGEAFINEEVIMHVEGEQLLGFIMCKKITPDIFELASLYVKPEYRGKGVAKGLLSQALDKVHGRDVITRTSNKAIKQSLIEHNFRPVSMKTNLKFAYIYLKDRMKSKDKFLSFVNTLNNKNCLFFRSGEGANPKLF